MPAPAPPGIREEALRRALEGQTAKQIVAEMRLPYTITAVQNWCRSEGIHLTPSERWKGSSAIGYEMWSEKTKQHWLRFWESHGEACVSFIAQRYVPRRYACRTVDK